MFGYPENLKASATEPERVRVRREAFLNKFSPASFLRHIEKHRDDRRKAGFDARMAQHRILDENAPVRESVDFPQNDQAPFPQECEQYQPDPMGLSWALRWEAVRPPLTADREGTGLEIVAYHLDATSQDAEALIMEYSQTVAPMTHKASEFFWQRDTYLLQGEEDYILCEAATSY